MSIRTRAYRAAVIGTAAILIALAGCTKKNVVGLERVECDGDRTYAATYYPQWADSVLVYGECDG